MYDPYLLDLLDRTLYGDHNYHYEIALIFHILTVITFMHMTHVELSFIFACQRSLFMPFQQMYMLMTGKV